ncbi:RagB/SusD family nutrient uptake outer membrane protein [Porphyromonas somerae]|uniref:RagB/SusD family nutrient uptake outer membrane protein n=1 Tax=Porphyromonas somerae TaxID=322095 RepID=UPI002A815A19|nr:RagB/SusD family nutrient uptake outer membrane protein [Porphyromonas somerae]MDY3884533.1 RagB/SusD family nutrient uptake outer membrane protein [Porphyromonas somerae]
MNKQLKYLPILLLLTMLWSSCDKYLDIVPRGQVIPETTEEQRALLNKGYNAFPRHKELLTMRGLQVTPNIDPYGLSGFPAYRNIYTWQDGADNKGQTEEYAYGSFYTVIFYCNSIIQEVTPKDEVLSQIVGEAYLLRAYSYFELTNMYGPKYSEGARNTKVVPINGTIDIEQTFPKATLGELYDQIETDLKQAEKYLKTTQWSEPRYKYRGSREALFAIASRISLYKEEWSEVLEECQKALGISKDLADLNQGEAKEFLLPTHYQSAENIWALEELFGQAIREFAFVEQGYFDSFTEGDLRKKYYFTELTDMNTWETKPGQNKIQGKDYRPTIRRAEIYLNAAEAAARLGKAEEAKQYLSTLLTKRYTAEALSTRMAELQPLTGEALVQEILLERQKELGVEGHEWYDYKRTTQPALSKVVEGKEYHLQQGDARYVLRIPLSAQETNPQLVE